jgi:hypothetical protein
LDCPSTCSRGIKLFRSLDKNYNIEQVNNIAEHATDAETHLTQGRGDTETPGGRDTGNTNENFFPPLGQAQGTAPTLSPRHRVSLSPRLIICAAPVVFKEEMYIFARV